MWPPIRLAAIEALAESWEDLRRTEGQVMTTAQANAWRDALSELRHTIKEAAADTIEEQT